jgi:hypothetical protein
MARLVPIEVETTDDQPKTARLVPVEEKQIKVTPVKQERTKLEQPLLKEANATSVKDVPEALGLVAKGFADSGIGMAAFAGGSFVDTYNILRGKSTTDENARKAYEFVNNASNGIYNKIRGMVPLGDQKGAEQIVTNLYAPLEKFATKGGEVVTDLTGSEVAGATAYATLQILPFLLGAKAVGKLKGGTVEKPFVSQYDKEFHEYYDSVEVNPKQPIIDSKAAIIDKVSEKLQEIKGVSPEEAKSIIQEADTLKQTSNSLGVVNAGEIPEGKIIELKRKKVPVNGQKVKEGQKETQVLKESGGGESNQFTATNNIKENQKSLTEAKNEVTKIATTKEERKALLKERVEAAKAARLKEIEELSHYEETPDPLTVDANKTVQDTLYKEPEGTTKPITLQDVNKIGKDKELGVNANVGANGDMIVSVTDKYGNKVDFPLTKNGVTLQHVHDYVKGWSDNFAESMKKQYDAKAEVVENAPELVKPVGPTKKHVIKSTGETIEYQKISELRTAYEDRGISWVVSKKEYYKAKKLTKEQKSEIDDKLTPPSQKSLPEIQLLDSEGNGKKPGILSWAEPFRFVAQDIEKRTGFPMQQFESKIRDGMRQVNNSLVPYMQRLRYANKGMNYESSVRIYRALENPMFRESNGDFGIFRRSIIKNEEAKGMFEGMTRPEYESAGKIRKILNDAADEFNVPIDKMVMDYAPRMMKEGLQGWTEAIKKWQLPEEYNWAALEERTGYLRPHEEQIFKVVDSYLRRGAKKRYVGNYLEELSNQLNKTKFESKADIDQLNKYVATMRGWQTGFDESIKNTGEVFARGLNKIINKSLDMVGLEPSARYRNETFRKLDVPRKVIDEETGKATIEKIPRFLKTGEEPGFFDVHNAAQDFINLHLKLSYAGALAFRPLVYVRSMYQSLLSMPIINPYWFAKGMAKVKSPEAWADAKSATALLQEAPVAAGELNKGWSIVDDITQKSTYNLTSGHNVGRFIAYHAMKEKSAYYGGKFLENIEGGMSEKKAIDTFIKDTGADFFHPVLIKNEIVPLLKSKDVQSLSERMGLHLTAETQWLYEKGQAPYWARSTAGRVLGQFGVWPSWYIKYARNLSTRGSVGTIAKRLGTLAAVNGLMYEVGKEIFGVDISSWMMTHPFMWSPMPMQAWDSARKMIGGSDYEKEKAGNALLNTGAIHIPGYLAIKDVVNGIEENRDEDKLKRFMGFKPSEE